MSTLTTLDSPQVFAQCIPGLSATAEMFFAPKPDDGSPLALDQVMSPAAPLPSNLTTRDWSTPELQVVLRSAFKPSLTNTPLPESGL